MFSFSFCNIYINVFAALVLVLISAIFVLACKVLDSWSCLGFGQYGFYNIIVENIEKICTIGFRLTLTLGKHQR